MKYLKLAVIVLFSLVATAVQATQTNVVQVLQIGLIAYTQGPSSTNDNNVTRTMEAHLLATLDILKLVGDATASDLSGNATLVLVTHLPAGDTAVEIRDGSKTVDVTQFFAHDTADPVIIRERRNTSNDSTTGGAVEVDTFTLKNGAGQPLDTHFVVSGFTRTSFTSVFAGNQNPIGEAVDFTALVSGTGDFDGAPAVYQGAVSTVARRIEVVSDKGIQKVKIK